MESATGSEIAVLQTVDFQYYYSIETSQNSIHSEIKYQGNFSGW